MHLNDISIRTELRPGDMGYVTHMHGRIYSQEYHFTSDFEYYVAKGLLEFYDQYDPATNRVWVCEYQDRIVGFMLLMNRGKAAQLRYFIFEAEVRGLGLGKKLMDLYMSFLKECGYESSYLLTTTGLPAAASLYERYGFVLTEERDLDAFGPPLKELRYELKV